MKHPQSLVFWICLQCLIVSCFWPSVLWAGDPKAEPDPAIKILVYNIAQAPRATLRGPDAKQVAFFPRLECAQAGSSVQRDTLTPRGKIFVRKGWEAINSLGLRILAKPMAFGNRFQGDHLGFAVFPALASVYYDDKLRFAGDDFGLGLPTILGCFMAHEIGHLLLGSNSHSKQGLMQAVWGERQIHQALAGGLLFTSNQASRSNRSTHANESSDKKPQPKSHSPRGMTDRGEGDARISEFSAQDSRASGRVVGNPETMPIVGVTSPLHSLTRF